jgi:HSP20 family protein
MSLVRWTPENEVATLRRDPFFHRFFEALDGFEPAHSAMSWTPRLDLVEEKDAFVATIELPGIDPKSVQIHFQDDVLTIQGERREEKQENGKVLRREQIFGSFTRSVRLPVGVQADAIKAQSKDGVLTIRLPKSMEAVGRTIPVETAE